MTKKELEKEIDKLREELGEFRYKAGKYNQAAEKVEELEKALSKHEGRIDATVKALKNVARELQLRLDVLTMTPEQIETMRKFEGRGRLNDPLDLVSRRRV